MTSPPSPPPSPDDTYHLDALRRAAKGAFGKYPRRARGGGGAIDAAAASARLRPASPRPSSRNVCRQNSSSSRLSPPSSSSTSRDKGGLPGAGVNREEVTAIRDQLHTQQRLHAERFASLEAQIRQANAATDDASGGARERAPDGGCRGADDGRADAAGGQFAAPPTRYSVAVPDGVAPGESFEANVGGVITRVTVLERR